MMWRTWLKTFLAMVSVILGASALWVWAATLTGPAGRNVVFTATNTVDVPILLQNSIAVKTQGDAIRILRANQALGATSVIQHASRADVLEQVQISSTGPGNITSTASPLRIAAGVANQMIQLCGTSASATYTLPDGNGVKLQSATPILFDDRSCMVFGYDVTGGTWRQAVTGVGGGGGGGTAASTSFAATGGIAANNVQTALAEVDSEAEKVAQKNVNNGYLGLNATGTAIFDRIGGYASDTPLSNSSQITPTALEMGIQGASSPVDLTSTPQIVAGTRDGQLLVLSGTHDTFTVKIDNGNGVRLCGNTGSLIIGQSGQGAFLRWNSALAVWEQIGCPSAQQVFNAGATVAIFTCGNVLNPKYDGGGGTSMEFCLDASGNPTWQSLVGGAPTNAIVQLSATKKFCVMKSDLTTELFCVNDSGTVTGLTATKPFMAGEDNNSRICGDGTGGNWYLYPSGRFVTLVAGQADQIMPGAYTFSNFTINRDAAAAGSSQTETYTLLKNGVATALSCQIIQGAGVGVGEVTGTTTDRECRETASTVTVVAMDRLTIRVNCTGGTAASGFVSTAMQYQ